MRKITDPNDRRFWKVDNVYDADEVEAAVFADWAPGFNEEAGVRTDGSVIRRPPGDLSTLDIGNGIDNG